MKKLDKKFKAKWLKALRSGKYKQTRTGALCRVDQNNKPLSYCCLGVACDILGKKPEDMKRMAWATSFYDLPNHFEDVMHDDAEYKLVKLNDAAHYSFDKIADWIEKNL